MISSSVTFCRDVWKVSSAVSRTVYQRYLRKFICVIPRVHSGYFKSSSHVFQRVHQKRLQQFLSEEGFFEMSRLWQRTFIRMGGSRKPEPHCSRDCWDRPWVQVETLTLDLDYRRLGYEAIWTVLSEKWEVLVKAGDGKNSSFGNGTKWQWASNLLQMFRPMDLITGADLGCTWIVLEKRRWHWHGSRP